MAFNSAAKLLDQPNFLKTGYSFPMKLENRALVWLRRDLRLNDHTPLAHATSLAAEVALVFVFDPNILDRLEDKDDKRLTFLQESLHELDGELKKRGSRLIVKYGDPKKEIPLLAKRLKVSHVCTGKDYEPYAKERDAHVAKSLTKEGIAFHLLKDQVIFQEREVLNKEGNPFRVFTPYKNAWLNLLNVRDYEERKPLHQKFVKEANLGKEVKEFSLKDMGFRASELWLDPGEKAAHARLKDFLPRMKNYSEQRNFPMAVGGTSGLSVHLRFGTISIRTCVRAALNQKNKGHETWLSELIWRDFYFMILDQFPHVVGHSFKKEYESIRWPGKPAHFEAWCRGETGFPIVDAAMRHFNETGWMHNRLRMVVASFLTKDLLMDWRLGEAYFARKLLDFDLSANNGGWQWSASTGCDAQPYFRIFNPYSQSETYDPKGEFIRSQIPELAKIVGKSIHSPEPVLAPGYPRPIVDHKEQREKALRLFKKA